MTSKRDWTLLFLIALLWATAYFAVFGVETSTLSRACQSSDLACSKVELRLIGIASLMVLPLLIWRVLLHRLNFVQIKTEKGVSSVPLRAAHPIVEQFVRQRADHADIHAPIQVYRIPFSGDTVNGYVWQNRRKAHMALSSKVDALVGAAQRGDQEANAKACFLIDHELGHIAVRDAGGFLMARAIIYAALILLIPAKLLMMRFAYDPWFLPGQDLFLFFRTVTEDAGLYRSFAVPPIYWALFALLVTTFAAIAITAVLLSLIKRRREYLADKFAMAMANDHEKASSVIRDLFKQSTVGSAVASSFIGGLSTHPSVKSRIRKLTDANFFEDSWFMPIIIVAMVIFSRIFLHDGGSLSYLMPSQTPEAVKWLYTFLVSTLIAAGIGLLPNGFQIGITLGLGRRLVVVGLAAAVIFIVFDFSVSLFQRPSTVPEHQAITSLEAREHLYFMLSLPITISIFIGAHTAISFLMRRWSVKLPKTALQIFGGFALGMGTIVGVTMITHPVSEQQRVKSLDRILGKSIEIYQRLDAVCPDDALPECEDYFRASLALEHYQRALKQNSFAPPLSWIWLSHEAFRRPAILA